VRRALAAGLVLAVAGGLAVTVFIGSPGRSAASYAAGIVVVVAVVAATTWVVARAATYSPVLSLIVAIGCYAATMLAFAVLLAAVDRTVVEVRALAAGIAAGVLIATLRALQRGLVRDPGGIGARQSP
jgi:hypothetical protein